MRGFFKGKLEMNLDVSPNGANSFVPAIIRAVEKVDGNQTGRGCILSTLEISGILGLRNYTRKPLGKNDIEAKLCFLESRLPPTHRIGLIIGTS